MAVADPDTRLANLTVGNERRLERVALMREVEAGIVNPAALVLDPPECLYTMFTFDFLFAIPRVGNACVQRLNTQAVRDGVNLAVPLGRLTESKRKWLATQLLAMRRPRHVLALRPQG